LPSQMTVSATGNVGIGSTSPNAELDVSGSIVASGTITSFTGSHVVYMSVEEGKEEETNSLTGLIASSTGKIPSITINNAWPEVRLASIHNDKSVFGVFNNSSTRNDYIVNSIGEGAMWVCDANGVIENGDYITSSVVPGYGQRQADDLLHNYTVAKITMDCDFTAPMIPKLVKKVQRVETEVECEVKDASGSVIYEEVPVLDESGNPIMEVVDVVDESGNVVGTREVAKTERKAKTETIIEVKTEDVLDVNGNVIMTEDRDASGNVIMVPAYEMRYLLADGTQITKEDYDVKKAAGAVPVYRAAFVGCTYHCG
jgi:hypothetical protein